MLNTAVAAPKPQILEVLDFTEARNGVQFQWPEGGLHDGGSWTPDAQLAGTITEVTVHWSEDNTPPNLSDDAYLRIVAAIARYHRDKNWALPGEPVAVGDGIMYHYIILPNGKILHTRPETRRTWNARAANGRNIAICVLAGAGDPVILAVVSALLAWLNWMCYGRADLPLVTATPQQILFGGKYIKTFGVLTHDESLTLQGQPTKGCCGIYSPTVKSWRAKQEGQPGAPADPDPFPVVGDPSITREAFAAKLAELNSPVLNQAPDRDGGYFWDIAHSYGIDPGVILEMFIHETNAGRYAPAKNAKGVALDVAAMRAAHNWANIRSNPDVRQDPGGRSNRRVDSRAYGFFRGYDHWADSERDACEKLLSPDYAGMTLLQAISRWAPKSDGNDPVAYTNFVRNGITAIRTWWQNRKAA